ncbi:cyanate lyase [Ectopseudomonas mendocina]|uniref:Cyanate hydratase n=1 Tax=Ectopseudomonas mendocina TaxID=300 RepID=A0A379J0F7_ECTME|nr:cyanase [Pseudomonas mendocina]MDF2076142.1 cyanase [Pseudomonas mendocina]QTN43902.1 cyanase [Pseudomonas mendocina]SUD36757.1 cyanate lyase [Pseudomonas mendocina]SUD41934.1 cyanate lyase [Pseudomonas mendocina]
MDKQQMRTTITAAKERLGLDWAALGQGIGMSPVWTTSACLGMNSMPKVQADALCEMLELPEEVSTALQAFPHKHWDKAVPTDPLIYRFYEMINVYGETIKELIHEEFGDGIMSAIDFSMDISRVADPKGDRVQIVLNGKFLPYRSW